MGAVVATAPPAGYVTDLFKALEDLLEHPEPAPPDEAIVNRLRPTIVGGRIAPSQAVPDDEDDAADDPTAIHPRHTARQRKNTARAGASARRTARSDTHRNPSSRRH